MKVLEVQIIEQVFVRNKDNMIQMLRREEDGSWYTTGCLWLGEEQKELEDAYQEYLNERL
jgi:hypothetical protein